jgi:hypothetical protein
LQVRRHFLAHGFFWYFLASVPVDFLMLAVNGFSMDLSSMGHFRWLQPSISCWFRVPRLFLIASVFRWWEKYILSSTRSLLGQALQRLLPLLFALSHLMACAWWMVGSWVHWRENVGGYAEMGGEASTNEFKTQLLPCKLVSQK